MTSSSDHPTIFSFYTSAIGKKIITGITGLGLSLFVLFHMLGNLTLIVSSQSYNQLAYWLDSLGIGLYLIEFILLGLAIFHIVVGITIRLNTRQARPINYKNGLKSVGEPSRQSLSSRSMAITGLILLAFLFWHLATFKFGTYHLTVINGLEMRDLAGLVIEKFQSPTYTFGYVGVIIFLAIHLRHGIWSAWQSIGALNDQISSGVYAIALILTILIAIGFVILPLSIYLGVLTGS